MADRYDEDRSDNDESEGEPSVFDLFEAPPTNNPKSFGKVPVIKDAEVDLTDGLSATERQAAADVEAAGLQHWTAPPTGQVPAVLSEKDPKSGLWGDVAGPSWHGDDPTWSGPDLADVFADTDSIRLDQADEEDDEEEDEEYRRPTPRTRSANTTPTRPAPSRPVTPDPAPTADPPLAAAPGRRTRPDDQSWPGDQSARLRSRPQPAAGEAAPSRRQPAIEPPDQSGRSASSRLRDDSQRRPVGGPAVGAESDPSERALAPAPRIRRDPAATNAEAPQPRPGASEDRTTWPTSPEPRTTRPEHGERVDRQATPPDHRLERAPAPNGERARLDATRVPSAAGGPSVLGDDKVPNIDDIEFAEPRQRIREPGSRSRARQASRRNQAHLDRERAEEHTPDLDRRLEEFLDPEPRGGRNLPAAIAVGAGLLLVLAAAIRFGPETTLVLVVVAAVLAVVELYNAMRRAGLRPANLLGIVGTAAAPAAAYYRGDAALPLIVGLTVVFGSLWYLVGADTERPVLNLSLTMMGIFWVGGLASFAGLMLRSDGGVDLLLAAIIITVTSDTMAYVGGRAYGRRPFHPASPNKTWEGTLTGLVAAVFAGFVIGVTEMTSFWAGNVLAAIALGAVVGILAPIGDLAESVVKRDLGVKDMGTILPGHGGVLDRVDALLFALPGAYYLGLVAGLL